MTVTQPYRRTARQFVDGKYQEGGRWMYIRHDKFCTDPEHFIRAYEIIQKDFIKILDYIEPDDVNNLTYSYRIHELYMRICIEIEANFKAILVENGYTANVDRWNINTYKKVEKSHFLSMYEVRFPVWRSTTKIMKPFDRWHSTGQPNWYQDYNAAKHDRHMEFAKANFQNLVKSITALVVLLSSQFIDGCFGTTASILASFGSNDKFETAIGGYFSVKFPENIPIQDRYEFDWARLQGQVDPFLNYPYV